MPTGNTRPDLTAVLGLPTGSPGQLSRFTPLLVLTDEELLAVDAEYDGVVALPTCVPGPPDPSALRAALRSMAARGLVAADGTMLGVLADLLAVRDDVALVLAIHLDAQALPGSGQQLRYVHVLDPSHLEAALDDRCFDGCPTPGSAVAAGGVGDLQTDLRAWSGADAGADVVLIEDVSTAGLHVFSVGPASHLVAELQDLLAPASAADGRSSAVIPVDPARWGLDDALAPVATAETVADLAVRRAGDDPARVPWVEFYAGPDGCYWRAEARPAAASTTNESATPELPVATLPAADRPGESLEPLVASQVGRWAVRFALAQEHDPDGPGCGSGPGGIDGEMGGWGGVVE